MRLNTITNLMLMAISVIAIITVPYIVKGEGFRMILLGIILYANWAFLFKYCVESGHYSDGSGVYGYEAGETWAGFAKGTMLGMSLISLFLIAVGISFDSPVYNVLINTPTNHATFIQVNSSVLLFIGQVFTLVIPALLFPLWASTYQDRPPKMIDFLFGFNRITDFIVHWGILVIGTFVLYIGQSAFGLFFR